VPQKQSGCGEDVDLRRAHGRDANGPRSGISLGFGLGGTVGLTLLLLTVFVGAVVYGLADGRKGDLAVAAVVQTLFDLVVLVTYAGL
jgi:membrane protease YdiL (CAAX protease family)